MLQLYAAGDNLQAKDKHIARLEASLEAQQTQLPQMQAEKESSDAATQFIYTDVAECRPEIFIVYIKDWFETQTALKLSDSFEAVQIISNQSQGLIQQG